tara:strand:- start:305 stop:535 length:231 start_codon:yes stop_codon:yes gene_type:complete
MCDIIHNDGVQLATRKALAIGGVVIATSIAGSAVNAIVNHAAEQELITENHINTGAWSVLGSVLGTVAWWYSPKIR